MRGQRQRNHSWAAMGLGLGAVVSELAFVHGRKRHVWSEWLQRDGEAGCLALLSRKRVRSGRQLQTSVCCFRALLGAGAGTVPTTMLVSR